MPAFAFRFPRLMAVVASLVVLAGCGGAAPTTAPATASAAPAATLAPSPTPAPTVASTPDLAHPVGVIAIGHSALTGEGTAGAGEPNLEASWATGTLEPVNSLYLRLTKLRPETEGHVSNKASGGAPAATLVTQAKAALALVPVPALAIIDTVDQDIQCNGANVASVGKSIANVLALIHEASPNTKILVVDQPGRPRVDFIRALVAHAPSMKARLTWNDPCSFYVAGNLNPEGVAKLSAVIDRYETEQFRVCALVPNCSDDGGVRRAYVDVIENLSPPDYDHFNVRGQAAQAELLWPVVEKILGL